MKNKFLYISYVFMFLSCVSMMQASFGDFRLRDPQIAQQKEAFLDSLHRDASSEVPNFSMVGSRNPVVQDREPSYEVDASYPGFFTSAVTQDHEDTDEGEVDFGLSALGDVAKVVTTLAVMYFGYKAYNFASNPDSQADMVKNITRAAKNELLQDEATLDALLEKAGDKIGKQVGERVEEQLKKNGTVQKVDRVAKVLGDMLGVKDEPEKKEGEPDSQPSNGQVVTTSQPNVNPSLWKMGMNLGWNYVKRMWPWGTQA